MVEMLANKTVLVTAGTSGLGTAFCRAMAAHGAFVAVHYRSDEAAAAALVEEIQRSGQDAMAVQADLRDENAVSSMVTRVLKTFGRIDVLINNASIYLEPQPIESVSWDDMQAEFEGSVKTAFLSTKAVLPDMLARKSGVIVMLIGTMVQRPASGYAAHTAGKGALEAYTRTLAHEVGPRGISVHMISPGMALTPNVLASVPAEEREKLRRKTPNRMLPDPETLARLAVFLSSDMAASATALHLNADGGLADLGG